MHALHHLPFQHFIHFLLPLSLSDWNVHDKRLRRQKYDSDINMEFVSWTARLSLSLSFLQWESVSLATSKNTQENSSQKKKTNGSSFCKLNCDGCQEYFRSFHFAIFTIATRLDFATKKMGAQHFFGEIPFSFRVRCDVLKR